MDQGRDHSSLQRKEVIIQLNQQYVNSHLEKNEKYVCSATKHLVARCYEVTLLDAHWREAKHLFRM